MATGHQAKPERRLPVQQLVILSIARVAEPIALTSVFPYLPSFIESLNVAPDEVAKWAGITASVFSLSQAVFGVPWGRASDRFGRKPVILLGLVSTMITSVLWGFSRTLWMAIVVRALQGAGNGNVGIIRTTVAEMVPWKELQPRAFSVMPLVWNLGSICGPALGGALANPNHIQPGQALPDNPSFLDGFPYALPNLVAASIFLIGITIGLLFLDESLETKKYQPDYARELGKRLAKAAKALPSRIAPFFRIEVTPEHERLLKDPPRPITVQDEEVGIGFEPKAPPPPPPSFREVLNRQSILNLTCYTLLALHNIAFDQLVPIFMHHPAQDHSPNNPDFVPPFKFAGGFGLDSSRIGLVFTLYGVWGVVVQFCIFPGVARKYGVAKCLRVCSVIMPITYLVMPFVALLPDQDSQIVGICCVLAIKGFCSTFAFPCSTILLTNSASSLRILGTLNGLATSMGAAGRAAGPAIGGPVFTFGVHHGYVIAPWWVLAAIAFIAAVPVYYVVEGEGFGGDDEVEDSDEEEEEQEEEREEAVLAEMAAEGAEEEYGSMAPLSRTRTYSSAAFSDASGDDLSPMASLSVSRRGSRNQGTPRRPSRRISIPLGMGDRGISRRYSSNLGQSFGSAGGYLG